MTRYWPWTELDIDPVNDERAVKRAYSGKLKALDPEKDAAGFIALRSAYDSALGMAKHGTAEFEYHNSNDYWDDEIKAGHEQPVAAETGHVPAMFSEAELHQYKRNRDVLGEEDPAYEAALAAQALVSEEAYDDTDYDFDDAPYYYEPPIFETEYGKNGAHIAIAMADLAQLHQGSDSKVIDENMVQSLFDRVITSPDLENIFIANRIENDLAMMIGNLGNKAYFLAELADYHFGWTDGDQNLALEWPLDQARQTAQESRFIRHIHQGKPRNETERQYIQALNWLEQGPRNWFANSGRRKSVMEVMEALQIHAPSVYYAIDENKIDAWEKQGDGIRSIGWPMALFALFSGFGLIQFLNIEFESLQPQPVALLAIWGIANAAVLAALLYRRPRIIALLIYQYPVPVPAREYWLFGGLIALIPVSLLGSFSIWTLGPLAILGAGAVALTTHPNLPKTSNFWEMLAQRRYLIGAFWVSVQASFNTSEISGMYLFLPTAIAAWGYTHAHPRFQASLDLWSNTVRDFSRWKLHVPILLLSTILFYYLIILAFATPAGEEIMYSTSPAMGVVAIILILLHDAITPRQAIVTGMQFYMLRFVALVFLILSTALSMLALIILRTMGVLYIAYRDARAAKAQGAEWKDHGDGIEVNNGGGGEGTIWSWIFWAFLILNAVRLIAQLGS